MALHINDPTPWLAPANRFFNPHPTLRTIALAPGRVCLVVDDALAEPQRLVDFAATQALRPPAGYPYPGIVAPAPAALAQRVGDFFAQHVRTPLGGRRTLDLTVRLSMVTTAPAALEPRQWQCHRDRVANDIDHLLFAASVLYLFHDPTLGGTSFYAPRRPPAETDRMLADSQSLDAAAFTARHGVAPGYMTGSNDWFERIAQVPAAWNRMIFYDGGLFHSADVDAPERLTPDAHRGRLTLNSFFTCRRNAR